MLCSTRPHLFFETTENVLQINRDAEADSLQGNKILIIITHGRDRRWWQTLTWFSSLPKNCHSRWRRPCLTGFKRSHSTWSLQCWMWLWGVGWGWGRKAALVTRISRSRTHSFLRQESCGSMWTSIGFCELNGCHEILIMHKHSQTPVFWAFLSIHLGLVWVLVLPTHNTMSVWVFCSLFFLTWDTLSRVMQTGILQEVGNCMGQRQDPGCLIYFQISGDITSHSVSFIDKTLLLERGALERFPFKSLNWTTELREADQRWGTPWKVITRRMNVNNSIGL